MTARQPWGYWGYRCLLMLVVMAAVGVLGGPAAPAAAAGPAPEPVLAGDFPDPFVLRTGSGYVAYSTQGAFGNVPMARSPDLRNWTRVGDALPTLPAWAQDGHTWAPSVLARGNAYVLYYTVRDPATGLQCISRARSDSPTGPFTDNSLSPFVCQNPRRGSIDPSPFVDADGSAYLIWKSEGTVAGEPTRVWVERLNPDGMSLFGGANELIRHDQVWEQPLIEGPSMVRAGGRYYLFYSASTWHSATYAIGYAICATAFGPCTKPLTMPWLASRGSALGPGGPEVFADAAGGLHLAHHAWMAPKVGYPAGGMRAFYIEDLSFSDAAPVISIPAVSDLSFAEGTVRDGFREFLTLQNPGALDTLAIMTFQATDDGGGRVAVPALSRSVPARSRVTIDVATYVRSMGIAQAVSISVHVTADQPLAAERPLYFRSRLAGGVDGGTTVPGARDPSTTHLFAEGTVRDGFQEFLTLQNPLTRTAAVTIDFQAADDAGTPVDVPPLRLTVAALTRVTVDVNLHLYLSRVPSPVNLSARVASDVPIVAERPLYFRSPLAGGVDGGTTVVGVHAPSQSAFFAEGTVRDGFVEFLTLQNPGPTTLANLDFQASDDRGATVPIRPVTLFLAANSRATVNLAETLARLGVALPVNLSVKVTAGQPIVAERPLYFRSPLAGGVNGATTVVGVAAPSLRFDFAEGTVRAGFQEFLTLQNPTAEAALATASFQGAGDDGTAVSVPSMGVAVPAGSRVTVDVNAFVRSAGISAAVDLSAQVVSDRPIVAERVLYFSTGLAGGANGGTAVAGSATPPAA